MICSCGSKHNKDINPSENQIKTQELLKKFFELKLDTNFNSSKSIIVIAESDGVYADSNLYSRSLKQVFFTDTISFNKLIVDSNLNKSILPVYVKSIKDEKKSVLLIFLHNQEVCYNVSFEEKSKNQLKFSNINIEYLNFKYKHPFNNHVENYR